MVKIGIIAYYNKDNENAYFWKFEHIKNDREYREFNEKCDEITKDMSGKVYKEVFKEKKLSPENWDTLCRAVECTKYNIYQKSKN